LGILSISLFTCIEPLIVYIFRCIILSLDDGTMRLLSLAKAAYDAAVNGQPSVGPKQLGMHVFNCSSFAIWSIQVSRLTGTLVLSFALVLKWCNFINRLIKIGGQNDRWYTAFSSLRFLSSSYSICDWCCLCKVIWLSHPGFYSFRLGSSLLQNYCLYQYFDWSCCLATQHAYINGINLWLMHK